MDKTDDKTQVISSVNKPSVAFSKEFTQEVDKYIEECKKNGTKITVKGFATRIGTDLYSVNAWANKKKKDDKGNLTEELARPNFYAAIQKLEKIEKENEPVRLNARQELFCKLYASDREFFGNGTQSYIEAYEINLSKPGAYKSAASSAYNLLMNTDILKRINELLEDGGLNDAFVDKQLLFVISQNADMSSKVAAMREYNKLKKRIIEQHDIKSDGQAIKSLIGFDYHEPGKPNTDQTTDQTNV